MGNYDPDRIQPISTVKTKLGLNTNIAALLCYVPFLAVNLVAPAVWLGSEPKDNYFLRFHSAQSLVMIAGYVALAIVLGITSLIPLIGIVPHILSIVLTGAFFLTSFFLMYASYNNRLVKLPLISDVAEVILKKIER